MQAATLLVALEHALAHSRELCIERNYDRTEPPGVQRLVALMHALAGCAQVTGVGGLQSSALIFVYVGARLDFGCSHLGTDPASPCSTRVRRSALVARQGRFGLARG